MKLTTDCPNCESVIISKRYNDQDWFLCPSCRSVFFSHESLRENWPSLCRRLKKRTRISNMQPDAARIR